MRSHESPSHSSLTRHPFLPRYILATLLATSMPACSGDLVFPQVDEALLTANCVRGSLEPPSTTAGEVTGADCLTGSGEPFETWRIRVADPASVRFEISFGFDDPTGTYALTLTEYVDFPRTMEIGSEFTSIGPTSNPTAEVWTLQPGAREYWLRVRLLVGEGPYQVTLTPVDGT